MFKSNKILFGLSILITWEIFDFKMKLTDLLNFTHHHRPRFAPTSTTNPIHYTKPQLKTKYQINSIENYLNIIAQGELPSIDDEIAAINNRKPAAVSPKKQKFDSQNSDSLSSPTTPSSVQRDYSRTPFKTKSKTAVRGDDPPVIETTSPNKRVKSNEYESTLVSSSLASSTPSTYTKQPSKSGPRNVLLRATQHTDVPAIERPDVTMNNSNAKAKSIRPSILRFGFIGLGFLGQRLLKNLLSSGHQVTIYNRSGEKCKQFLEAGAKNQDTPADVVENSDIVFSCVSGPDATKEIIFGNFGVVTKMDSTKAYVEMSSIDPVTSNDISEAITECGGRYLEAPPVANGRTAAEEGELTILAAGEKSVYEECSSCFQAMSKQTFFLGHRVGYASKMNLIISTLYGNMAGAIAECCALVERNDLQLKSLQDILRQSIMHSPLIDTILDKIISKDNSINMPLFQLQKDLRLSLSIAEECEQTCPITAITNEVFKQAKKTGYSEYDVSAVYFRSRF